MTSPDVSGTAEDDWQPVPSCWPMLNAREAAEALILLDAVGKPLGCEHAIGCANGKRARSKTSNQSGRHTGPATGTVHGYSSKRVTVPYGRDSSPPDGMN